MQVVRTNSGNIHFIELVDALNAELAEIDGDDHAFYDQFNNIEDLNHGIVLYLDKLPIGCGALKIIDQATAEVKRMYVLPTYRGQGLASKILNVLESWAKEIGIKKCILETGKRQPGAIRLYQKNEYCIIPNYGPYRGIENSVCFEKIL